VRHLELRVTHDGLVRMLDAIGALGAIKTRDPAMRTAANVARQSEIEAQLAAGEHTTTRWEFLDLMDRGGVQVVQPYMTTVGGLTEARRVVERIPGRRGGTFIVEPTIECDITGLAGFTEQLRRGQVRASARVVSARIQAASAKVSKSLEIPRDGDVYEVVRVRRANGQPLALERSYLPAELFPGLLDKRLTGSLYARMARDYDLAPQTATEYLEPYVAGEAVAKMLEVPVGSALLRIERTAASAAGQPIEYASDLFRPDRIRITVRTVAGAGGTLRAATPT